MIRNRGQKIAQITETIRTRASEFSERYRRGPSLYLYKRVSHLRNTSHSIEGFLGNDYHMEILYATLVSWDMNSRAARMKGFGAFKANVLSCLDHFRKLEAFENDAMKVGRLPSCLRAAYDSLSLMETHLRLVSNSKLLHFLFPRTLMPMDGNTLTYFYGHTGESANKYVEITGVLYEIMRMPEDWRQYLDNEWNTTVPKLVDNAIIFLGGKSVR